MNLLLLCALFLILKILSDYRKNNPWSTNKFEHKGPFLEKSEDMEAIKRQESKLFEWNKLADPIRIKIRELEPIPNYTGDNIETCILAVKKANDLLEEINASAFPDWQQRLGLHLTQIPLEQLQQIEAAHHITLPADFKEFAQKAGIYSSQLYYDENPIIPELTTDMDSLVSTQFLYTSDHGSGIEAGISLHPDHMGEYWVLSSGGDDKLAENIISFELEKAKENLNQWMEEDSKRNHKDTR